MYRGFSTEKATMEDKVRSLIDNLRGQCLKRGVGGIRELSVVFRRMDVDFSKRLCYQEFEEGVKAYELIMTNEDIDLLFNTFDTNKNRQIDFLELVAKLRPPMCQARKNVVNQSFDRLDANQNGILELEDLKKLVLALRNKYHGVGGIKEMSVAFRHMDLDFNKREIYFFEFVAKLRPPMNTARNHVANEVFDKLDANDNNVLETDDLKIVYSSNARKHPKYMSGEWTEEQVLRNFLDSIDTPGNPDGKVTREEFLNYYAGVSATVDDDSYFDLMMRACYGLPNKGEKTK
ncbi:CAPSL-like protein [Mya arenaria]|uniref:CAPSL-like protein n=1 Tax=Mya arenaria TaxID=6604 RepID=A0ABY7DDU2_MYAAR|nr:CAPSL-like protein [Mya arenaria]